MLCKPRAFPRQVVFSPFVLFTQVHCYDPEEDHWTYVASCPVSQRCINAVAHNNIIYVVGGLLDKIYSYTPKTDTWSNVVGLPMKLVCTFDRKLLHTVMIHPSFWSGIYDVIGCIRLSRIFFFFFYDLYSILLLCLIGELWTDCLWREGVHSWGERRGDHCHRPGMGFLPRERKVDRGEANATLCQLPRLCHHYPEAPSKGWPTPGSLMIDCSPSQCSHEMFCVVMCHVFRDIPLLHCRL